MLRPIKQRLSTGWQGNNCFIFVTVSCFETWTSHFRRKVHNTESTLPQRPINNWCRESKKGSIKNQKPSSEIWFPHVFLGFATVFCVLYGSFFYVEVAMWRLLLSVMCRLFQQFITFLQQKISNKEETTKNVLNTIHRDSF